jgi:hypothetical protein
MPAIHAMTAITCSALIHSYIRDVCLVRGSLVLAIRNTGMFDLISALPTPLVSA